MTELDATCRGCGTGNPARNRFCTECGGPLETPCPTCGEANPSRARFCGQCGSPLATARLAVVAPGSAPAAPHEYTPGDLAERVLSSRATMEGERKQVTVLFADVVGSTKLIRDLDAEAAVRRLQPAVKAMIDAVHRHEGFVNRVQGDGVMALFGAPIAHEDHAARGCLAALGMRDAVNALGDPGLGIRVGLNSGEVVVHAIRNDLTVDYDANGPTVHLAARMEQLADPGTVRITRRTFRLAEGYIEGRPLGALAVKGIDAPVEQVEVVRPVEAASRWEIRARRGLTHFVGRQAELGVLDQALALAAEGHGQVVAIAGEPGMGKSRLLHEFLSSHVPDGWTVRVTAAASDGTDTPFLPLRTLLRAVAGAEPGNTADDVAARVERFLAGLSSDLAGTTAALRALADVPVGDPAWAVLEPSQRRRRIIDAFKALALHRAALTPLLLVLEDLHWVDSETQAALDTLVESVPSVRLMLVASYRPEYDDRWAGRSWHQRVRLTGLGASGSDVLASALLGAHPSLATLRRLVAERTEGCPLFVEEAVRALNEAGKLEGAPGAYRLAGPVEGIDIPESVQAVLAARMDRLDPETKRVLQTAAVIGRVVPLPLLARVCGINDGSLADRVTRLQAGEFLFERAVLPVHEFVFKHALTETVAYEELLRQRRTELHAAVLDAMESLDAGSFDEQLESLARHAFLGERWAAAVDYLRRAGLKATAQSAYPEARRHLEQALAALTNLPDDAARARAGLDVRLELRPALGATGRYPEILRRLEEAEALAESLSDTASLLRVHADKIHVLYHLGHCAQAIEVGERAVAAAQAYEDRRALVQTTANLGHAHFWRGEFRRALDIAEPYAVELQGPLRHERIGTTATSSCLWLGNLCGMHAMLGEFAQAVRYGETARRIAAETNRPFDFAISESWHGLALLTQGGLEEAWGLLDGAYRAAAESEIEFMRVWCGAWLGATLLQMGRADKALALVEEAFTLSERLELTTMGLWARIHLADALLALNKVEAARRHSETALKVIRSTGFLWAEPAVLRSLAGATLVVDGGASGAATRLLREASELCRRQEAAPEQARVLLDLGRALAAEQQHTEARDTLGAALELFESLGMQRWVPETTTAIAALTR